MISPEIIRRYPFFAGLTYEQIGILAKLADESRFEKDHIFFQENDVLKSFYLVLEGAAAIIIEVPDRDVKQPVADQLTGEMKMTDIVLSTVGSGDVFGFPALIPPYNANASAKAITPCRVVAFDCTELLKEFDKDCGFGYVMTQRVAQLVVERLRDIRVESLAFIS
ncbi:Crp/Fnr family transcriptional regulator [Chloroflexota bacterium]